MITVNFEEFNKLGLCETIYQSIKRQIQKGILKPNEKLPSKRSFSEHLGVSVITVQNAYGLLIDEGWIYSVEKKGFFVTDIANLFHVKKPLEKSLLVEEINEEINEENLLGDFVSNSINIEKFPFSVWARITRKVLTKPDKSLFSRQSVWGIKKLRQAIQEYLYEYRGMLVDEKQIIIGAGTESLYTMIIQFLGQENLFALENPGYKKVGKIIELNKADFLPVDIDSQGIKIQDLEKSHANIVHVSPSHHFPTGIIMTVKRRNLLLQWAMEKENRFIIEDEYDSEFRFIGKPLAPLFNSDSMGKVIYINTFSKTVSPSLRISYMILPENLLQAFDNKMSFYSCPVSAVEQMTLALFIKEGHFETHISRMRNYYRNLRNELIYQLNLSSLSEKALILEENSGLQFLLEFKNKINQEKVREDLKKEGILINFLSDYEYSQREKVKKKNTMVINYSGIEKSKIKDIIQIMERLIS